MKRLLARWILTSTVAVAAMAGVAAPALATEFFKGDFETGNLSQWNYVQAIPGRVSVVTSPVSQGAYAGRFEVKAGDKDPDTGSQRAELFSGEEFEESNVRYFRILSRVDSWDFGNWGILWKVQDQSGPPPLTLQIRGGATPKLWLGPGDGSDDYWEAPLPELGNWFEVVVRVEFGGEGSLSVWLNGQPQTMLDGNGGTVFDVADTLGEGPAEDKIGLHRSSSSVGTSVVYHDDYRVSDTFFSDPPEPTPLFKGDFETGNLSQWDYVQAIPGRVSVVTSSVSQGTYAGRFEVKEGDEEPDTLDERAEVESGLRFKESDVRYFRILSRVSSWDFGHWGIVWQMHDDGPGSPPLSLQLQDGSPKKLWLGHGEGEPAYWQATFPGLNTWFEVVIRVEFGVKGSLRVWLNGVPQTMLNGKTTYGEADTLGEAPGYDKLGIYRSSSSTGTAVVYHDDYRVSEEFFSDPP
jgi:hypothetical protein